MWSLKEDSTLAGSSLARKVSNTLAYYDTEIITTVKSLMVLATQVFFQFRSVLVPFALLAFVAREKESTVKCVRERKKRKERIGD